jgi:tetratricopeptide (TPR) repeat protein
MQVNQLDKALEVFDDLLKRAPNDIQKAANYNNIGLVYRRMVEYQKALSFYERALAIRETTLLANHPDLAQSYNNIGIVYMKMGEYPRALSYYTRALKIFKLALGDRHPHTKSVVKSIELVKKRL